ncbi:MULTISPECIES: hypothetical protein [Micromonospora]|uniref:hypothetical protein n=1 Tax=Micromonospora TaxID=1873 RepID=UPI000F892A28|nr:hypothetical protein [Verrucosispora sp. FIM060022]RUL89832.1 hypothetical protein EG812_28675 [Verrucosispora sp. FIM060022]
MYLRAGGSAVECHGTGLTLRQVDDILARVEIITSSLDSYTPGACRFLGRCVARLPVTPV